MGPYRKDCSGLARAIYKNAGKPLGGTQLYAGENDVSILYRYSQKHGRLHRNAPSPGDLVFFDNTTDLNRDGAFNDLLTHVGVVEKVRDDGTIIFVHQIGPRPVRARMNLSHPQKVQDGQTGQRLNHILRRGKKVNLIRRPPRSLPVSRACLFKRKNIFLRALTSLAPLPALLQVRPKKKNDLVAAFGE